MPFIMTERWDRNRSLYLTSAGVTSITVDYNSPPAHGSTLTLGDATNGAVETSGRNP